MNDAWNDNGNDDRITAYVFFSCWLVFEIKVEREAIHVAWTKNEEMTLFLLFVCPT